MLVTEQAKLLADVFASRIAKGKFMDESPEGTNRWTRGLNFYDLQILRAALFAASTVPGRKIQCTMIDLCDGSGPTIWTRLDTPASRWDRVAAFRRVCNENA